MPAPLYSLKKRCRFRTATSSFIYPAGYAANVRVLGNYFDEIELLFLESKHANDLPDKALLQELNALQNEFDLTYNIHLPTDIRPNTADTACARQDLDALLRFVERTLVLQPTSFCLHLPFDDAPDFAARCHNVMHTVMAAGVDSRKLAVENLDYPLTILAEPIRELDVGVCFDIGHAFVYATGFAAHVDVFRERIETVHLHGPGHKSDDHNDLSYLGDNWLQVLEFLQGFTGTLVLELFDIKRLNASLAFLGPYLEQLA